MAPHASASVPASSPRACLWTWVSSPPTHSLPCESRSSLLCSRAQRAFEEPDVLTPTRACRPAWDFGPSPLGPSLSHSANTHLPLSQVGPVWEAEAPWGNQTQPPGKAPRGRAGEGRVRSPQGRALQVERTSGGPRWAPFCFFRARLPQPAVRHQGHQDLGVRVGRAALSSGVGTYGRETAPLPG